MAEPHVDDNKDGPDEYVVEAVKNKKVVDGITYYLIKWLGWPLEESTWEPIENCEKCENLIQEYEDQQRRQREADASARQAKADESSNSTDSEIISDYETRRGSRRRKKKGRTKKLSRVIVDDDDDDDDSDFETSRKSKKRRIKKGKDRNHESGYLSTDYLNGGSTTLDSDSSSAKSKKSKEPKDSINSSKKTRLTRENEAIKQYMGTSGSGVRSRDRSSVIPNEDTRSKRTVSSSSCAKESESKQRTVQNYSIISEEVVQQQHTLEEPPINQPFNQPSDQQPLTQPLKQPPNQPSLDEPKPQPIDQPCAKENPIHPVKRVKEEEPKEPDSSINSKRRCRISSTDSSEDEDYEKNYFGWERGKKITEIIDWYAYQDKVLHHVRYQDGEEEYVDDTYTCKHYPVLVFQLYEKYINEESVEKSEDQTTWFNFAIQRFKEIEENGPYEEEEQKGMLIENGSSDDGQAENNESGPDNEMVEGGEGVEEAEEAEEADVRIEIDPVITEASTEQQESVNAEAGDGENSDKSESGDEDNQNQPDEYFGDGEAQDEEEVEEQEAENDENNQNYHNFDIVNSCHSNYAVITRNAHEETANSVIVVNSTMEDSFSQNDSVFIVHSDSSFTQPISSNQPIVNPEFVIEESDFEDDLICSGETIREAIYGPICNGDTPTDDNLRVDEPDPSSDSPLFNPSPPANWEADDAEEEILFDPSPPSPIAHEFQAHLPPDSSVNLSSSLEVPDINESDDGELNEEVFQFDPSPPTSPYQEDYHNNHQDD